MSLFKELGFLRLHEALRGEFRAKALNIFNHPHLQGSDATVGASEFGMIHDHLHGQKPSQLQLALKLYFGRFAPELDVRRPFDGPRDEDLRS